MVKKKYGQIIDDHRSKNLELQDDVIEYRRLMEKDILDKLYETVEAAKKSDLYVNRSFYVVMLIKKELGGAPRHYIFARRSCPTPVFRQCVWKYHPLSGSLEFLWSLPDKLMHYHILKNKHKFLMDKECSDITKFCILMESGQLLDWVKKENNEDEKLSNIVVKIKNEVN